MGRGTFRGNANRTDWAWQPLGQTGALAEPPIPATAAPLPGDLHGWEAIGRAAGVGRQEAATLAHYGLSVEMHHGTPCAHRAEVAEWRRRHDVSRPYLSKLRGVVTVHNAHVLHGEGVYAVTFADAGRVKIGYSATLALRVASLETACPHPLEALAFIVGDRALERELHARLADYRAHREWFTDCPEVRTVLVCAGRKHGGVWAL